jgi:hypothetical protein
VATQAQRAMIHAYIVPSCHSDSLSKDCNTQLHANHSQHFLAMTQGGGTPTFCSSHWQPRPPSGRSKSGTLAAQSSPPPCASHPCNAPRQKTRTRTIRRRGGQFQIIGGGRDYQVYQRSRRRRGLKSHLIFPENRCTSSKRSSMRCPHSGVSSRGTL